MIREWEILPSTAVDPTGPDSLGDTAPCTGSGEYEGGLPASTVNRESMEAER